MKKLFALVMAIAMVLTATSAFAAGYPEKDITLVNPYEAGGTSDIPSRIFADYISNNCANGHLMNVNCIGGAGGAVGAQAVMDSPADGYTFLVAPAGFAMKYAQGTLDWTYEAFDPVCLYVTSVLSIVVRADSPYRTYQDVVDAAKANPGTVKMGIATGGLPQFSVYAMEAHDGIKFQTIDIGGNTVKSAELLAGRVDVMIDAVGGVQEYVKSGDFRILTVFSAERLPSFPEVPTMLEAGFTSDEMSVMNQVFGVWAPKGTPAEAIAAVSKMFGAAAADAGVVEQLGAKNYTATYMDTPEYTEYLAAMYTNFVNFANEFMK
ncbi:MAG: tripartite tricarboxylate transporter substrate binding protein [Clostridia bacterium]|nr:tripartite tricarboxylate transporter substrate binding protein [Clostridia bacterium]